MCKFTLQIKQILLYYYLKEAGGSCENYMKTKLTEKWNFLKNDMLGSNVPHYCQ